MLIAKILIKKIFGRFNEMGHLAKKFIIILVRGFPDISVGKESTCNEGDLGSNSGLGRSPKDGKVYPFHYSGLENSMDCIVHGVAESTRLSDFHFPNTCY